MNEVSVSIVVAMAGNRAIGVNNGLPWRLPRDLAHFKRVTLGFPIVMGRKTFDSIGRALPGRTNIVVTRQLGWQHEGVEVAADIESALKRAKECALEKGLAEVMLIGGASLYDQCLKAVNKIYLTEVGTEVDGDAFFPELSKNQWQEVTREDCAPDESNCYSCSFVVLQRKA